MKPFSKFTLVFSLLALLPRDAPACDACALFVATEPHAGLTAAVAQQFTRFGSVWNGSTRLPNPADQYLNSAITQLTLGYGRSGAWHWQATLPYIARSYRRPEHALIETGRVRGVGDATLATRYVAFRREAGETFCSIALLGGVEFGTGNSDRLGDEVDHHFHHHANFADSGIHGHDLALGSGSTDYVLGADAEWRRGRMTARASVQHKLRRPGAFGYRIADETSWELSAGRNFVVSEAHVVTAHALYSGERKGFDTLAEVTQVDTGFRAQYLGARATWTHERWTVEAQCELPVRIRTTEVMAVPDYRLRAALTRRL